ncbi:terminase small subunit [Magnetospirillum sp. SS-4]|uniref:terminase small subunit n=1 Tax=Magnetospirillum sp. SS-4 TaxID=2681465 RepID=UPI00138404EE|nr:terminase small subunit [Magnetospirillum sp. SS-4]CAA7626651.1 Terminase small subunit [Magnetospirillum sp. SS-4]
MSIPCHDNLTARQERFVQEYLIDLNATRAAIRAGYSARTAAQQGERLLRNVEVKREVERAMSMVAQRIAVTVDRVVEELAVMAFFDPANLISVAGPEDIAKLPEPVRRAIVGWSWDRHGHFVLRLADKGVALERIGHYLGMFVERKEVGAPGDFDTMTMDQKMERARVLAKLLGLDRVAGNA